MEAYKTRTNVDIWLDASPPLKITVSLRDTIGYFKAANTTANNSFRYALAVNADGNTLVVAAVGEDSAASCITPLPSLAIGLPGDNKDAPDAVAVYVFGRASETGIFEYRPGVKVTNTEANDRFGTALLQSAGSNTLVVGAKWEVSAVTGVTSPPPASGGITDNNQVLDAGAVYLY